MNKMELGKKIRARRETLGLTQPELSGKVGISQAFISDVENGKSTPSVMVLVRLSAALNLTVGELLEERKAG